MAAYPRKQTVFIFVICALITGGTAFYVYGQNSAVSNKLSAEKAVSVVSPQNVTKEIVTGTDWRSQFLGSATSSAFNTASAKNAVAPKEAPLTAVDLLGRSFLTKYGELRQAGLTNDSDAVLNAMNNVVSENSASIGEPKTYSSSDIRVVIDNTQIVNAYKVGIKAISTQYSIHQDEAVIAGDALESGDTSKLAEIDQSINDYKKMLAKLQAMPVPQTFVQNHLSLMNGISALLYSARAFRNIDVNPIAGFAAVRTNALGSHLIDAAFLNI